MSISDDAANGATSVTNSLSGWLAAPFSTSMSASGWALFTGLIMVISILWIMVLRDLRGEI